MRPKRFNHYLLPIVVLSILPAVASAFDYSYVDGGVLYRNTHNNDRVDNGGFNLGGSVGVLPNIAVIAGYSDTGNYDQIGAGALFHTPINSRVDLNLGATVEHADGHYHSDTGLGLRGGVRWQVLPALELDPQLRYVDLNGGMTSARLGALYRINDSQLFLQGAVQAGDDDRVEAGVRYAFGR
ncbi:MAG: hypothetical protein ACRESS_00420 [Stenotrophobium sp.]